MNPLIAQFILSNVLTFVLRQIEQYGADTNWPLLKADAEPRVRKLVPGTWFDDSAVSLVNAAIDAAAIAAGKAGGLKPVLELVAAGDWLKAKAALKQMMMSTLTGGDQTNQDLVLALGGLNATHESAA